MCTNNTAAAEFIAPDSASDAATRKLMARSPNEFGAGNTSTAEFTTSYSTGNPTPRKLMAIFSALLAAGQTTPRKLLAVVAALDASPRKFLAAVLFGAFAAAGVASYGSTS